MLPHVKLMVQLILVRTYHKHKNNSNQDNTIKALALSVSTLEHKSTYLLTLVVLLVPFVCQDKGNSLSKVGIDIKFPFQCTFQIYIFMSNLCKCVKFNVIESKY